MCMTQLLTKPTWELVNVGRSCLDTHISKQQLRATLSFWFLQYQRLSEAKNVKRLTGHVSLMLSRDMKDGQFCLTATVHETIDVH